MEGGAGLLQALASCGGLNDFARRDRIFVLREHPEQVRIRFTWLGLLRGEGRSAAFKLQPGDSIVVE